MTTFPRPIDRGDFYAALRAFNARIVAAGGTSVNLPLTSNLSPGDLDRYADQLAAAAAALGATTTLPFDDALQSRERRDVLAALETIVAEAEVGGGSDWLLSGGVWSDAGFWRDDEFWEDAA